MMMLAIFADGARTRDDKPMSKFYFIMFDHTWPN